MNKESIALCGVLLFGLVLGYFVGAQQKSVVQTAAEEAHLPNNYDPQRALFSDALKQQQAATDSCWKQVVVLLGDRVKTNPGNVAHE